MLYSDNIIGGGQECSWDTGSVPKSSRVLPTLSITSGVQKLRVGGVKTLLEPFQQNCKRSVCEFKVKAWSTPDDELKSVCSSNARAGIVTSIPVS